MKPGEIIKSFTSKKGQDVKLRYLNYSDVPDMLAYINTLIEEDTFIGLFGAPLSLREETKIHKEIMDQMKKGDKAFVVVEVDGKYSGAGDIRRNAMRRSLHVGEIGISLLPQHRDAGIGTELLGTLIEEAKKMKFRLVTLSCFENNPRALHLYEKMGFKKVGIIPGAVKFKDDYVGEVKMFLPLV